MEAYDDHPAAEAPESRLSAVAPLRREATTRLPRPAATPALALLHDLRGHATKLALGLGPPPHDETGFPAWQERRRGRALFLVALAEWDPTLLHRALLTFAPTPATTAPRMLLLEAIQHCA